MSDQLKTLKDYQPTVQEIPEGDVFVPSYGLGDEKFSTGNTNEPVQDRDESSMGPEGSGGGPAPSIAWRLSVEDDDGWKFTVASERSTLTDGTNGTSIDLPPTGLDTPTPITGTRWIICEIDVDAADGHALSNPTITSVADADDAREILVTGTPPAQTKLRLLVGKIVFNDGVPSAIQGEDRPQVIDWAFFDGVEVKAFGSPQIDPEALA